MLDHDSSEKKNEIDIEQEFFFNSEQVDFFEVKSVEFNHTWLVH